MKVLKTFPASRFLVCFNSSPPSLGLTGSLATTLVRLEVFFTQPCSLVLVVSIPQVVRLEDALLSMPYKDTAILRIS